jgi:phosphoglycolate phosphatase
MKFEAVIFDLDGTLVDTIDDIADTYNTIMKRHAWPTLSVDDYKQLVGSGVRNLLLSIVPEDHRDDASIDALQAEWHPVFHENSGKKARPYPGIVKLLERLQAKGVATAVLSNKPHPETVQCIETAFPEHRFTAVQGHCEGVALKPDPTSAMVLIEKLGVPIQDIALVGDTPIDIQTARAAGITPIAVTWGFRTEAQIRTTDVSLIAHTADELTDCILGG